MKPATPPTSCPVWPVASSSGSRTPFGKVSVQAHGVLLAVTAQSDVLAALAAVQAAGLTLRQAKYGRADLEHLFMALTHRSLRD